MWEKLRQKINKRKPRKSKWGCIFKYCAIFFRWCCLATTDQVSMIPVPLISPVQFYLKVFTCVVLGKEPVFIFLVVRTTKRPQTRWISSLESWARLKRAPNTLACQTLHWWSCSCWHVCHHSWFHHPSIQTSTNLSCTCNQNQLTWSRGELLGLETCCFGQRPCRVWISADPDPYSLFMWEISLWFVLKY